MRNRIYAHDYSMSQHDDELFRHEVRGVFVLGVIGTLLALWQLPNIVFTNSPRVTLHIIIAVFTGFWGLFIFFMTVAVSKDWVSKRIVDASYSIAKVLFLLGIGVLFSIFVMIGVAFTIGVRYGAWIGIITAFVMGLLFSLTQPSEGSSKEKTKRADEHKL